MPTLVPTEMRRFRDDTYDVTPTTSVQVTGGASSHTLGTVTEILAVTKAEADMLLIGQTEVITIAATNTATLATFYVDTGTGDVSVIGPVEFSADVGASGIDLSSVHMFPLYVPKGSQILAQVQGAQLSETATFRVWPTSLGLFDSCRRCVTYGAVTASSTGTQVTGGAAAWGTWTQITASTTAPCRWIVPSWGHNATVISSTLEKHLQIGYGASGQETVIGTAWHSGTNTNEVFYRSLMLPARVNIPTGARLSARVWNPSGSTVVGVCLHTFC